ncbi:MAG TPA: DUF4267 domain-containing protein [Stackebrandtia sp.]|jgi:hypothetical protein|uniref:DUF4267 domain-containing protein n=1 Tax=Stackebrandtia sp. TaxID=2023065 RepID=UPI002D50F284|nr:DUF4267 domain-containing protein [Stackebrandtia sp.]HZE41358.1 DUF4267 domain-containing protein [Stackebrandtia sp.]
MWLKRITVILILLLVAFVFWFGTGFLYDPHGMAVGFGLPKSAVPSGDVNAFLNVKGVRDVVTGLIPLVLLLTRQIKALAWVLLTTALIPIGDATIIFSYGGDPATAIGVHLATATYLVVTSLLCFTIASRAKKRSVEA